MAQARAETRFDRFAYYGVRCLSQAGQALFLVAILVASSSGSSFALGLSSVMAATMAGPLVFGLLAGSLADRLGPGRAYSLGAVGRLAAVAAGFLVVGRPEFAWAAALAYSSVSQLFSPSEMAMVPLVEPRSPARAHALLVMLQYVGQGVAAIAVAPMLLLAGGTAAVLAAAVAVYVSVAALAALLGLRVRSREAGFRTPARHAFSIRRTASFLTRDHRAAYAFGSLAFVEVVLKCVVVALPAYLLLVVGPGRAGLVAVAAPAVAGGALGLWWAGSQLHLHDAQRVMRLTLIGVIVSLFALAGLDSGLGLAGTALHAADVPGGAAGFDTGLVLVLPVALLFGASLSVAPIAARAVLSSTAPHGHQAGVFASQSTLAEVVGIAPLVLTGLGTEFARPRPALAFVALAGVAVFLFLEGASAPRTPLAALPAPADPPIA